VVRGLGRRKQGYGHTQFELKTGNTATNSLVNHIFRYR